MAACLGARFTGSEGSGGVIVKVAAFWYWGLWKVGPLRLESSGVSTEVVVLISGEEDVR